MYGNSFHTHRRPKLLFEYESSFYEGRMTEYGQNGFQFICRQLLPLLEGDTLPTVQLFGPQHDTVFHHLMIEKMTVSEGCMRVDLTASYTKYRHTFRQQFHVGFLGHSRLSAASQASESGSALPAFVGRKHYTQEAIAERHRWLDQVTGRSYPNLKQSMYHDNPSVLAGNIEQYIGAVQIPVGIAGPIHVNGTYANGSYPVPIATSEGALISSISRGARGCNAAGGVDVYVNRQVMLRSPLFHCPNMQAAQRFAAWMRDHETDIRAKAESVSSVAKLVRLQFRPFGSALHVQFYYETGDAAGQNMTTSCTFVACEWIMEQIQFISDLQEVRYVIEGNMAGDKKVTYSNLLEGRGIQVMASVHLSHDQMARIFRVSSEAYMHSWNMAETGALQTGMIGHNVNVANVIAGIFTATGQDIACVHESSTAIFKPIMEKSGITFHLQLPSLVIGTVGGGTNLPAQREGLEMMDCYGPGKVYKLAEIIAASCLALDISTSTAIESHQFVKAHEKLGRKASGTGIARNQITPRFFQSLLEPSVGKVTSFDIVSLDTSSSVVSNMLKNRQKTFQGLHRYVLSIEDDTDNKSLPVVMKVKSGETDMMELGVAIAKLSGDDRLSGLFESQMHIFGFEGATGREIEVYTKADSALLTYCPVIYGVRNEPDQDAHVILMEDLSDCSHFNTITQPEQWDAQHIECVLNDLADLHSVYWNQPPGEGWGAEVTGAGAVDYSDATELLLALTTYNHERYPQWISDELYKRMRTFIEQLPEHAATMADYHQTLTHNDFTTRNIALRSSTKQLVVYDWELARYQNPQHDVLEFLIYALDGEDTVKQMDHYLNGYRKQLERVTSQSLDPVEFARITMLNALELLTVRYNLYLLANNLLHLPYMERVYGNLAAYIETRLDDSRSGCESLETPHMDMKR
ncbi:phosphotransferase [Marinicrinis sediminis]|uniref:hydroxymethylglutaryl-CoA reductase (NADPH) n=1 Tax=Marinicrinis sediminis TaxID=1652465 RepID=A0ABW5RAV6_9BACL